MIWFAYALLVVVGTPVTFIIILAILRNRAPEGMKRLACRITWHSFTVGYDRTGLDGFRARCLWCDFVGSVDSQGNLF